MRIGIGIPAAIPGVDSSSLIRWAVRAEELGFNSIGVIDRVVYDNHDPLLVLAAAAAVTERVELITNVLVAPLRTTALLAKQAATLDRLSRGRLTLGVGLGGRADDYTALGLSAARRGAHLERQLSELRQVWAGDAIGPEPSQPGGPPILVAGYVPAAIERAARLADGWTLGVGDLAQFQEGRSVLHDAWARRGRPGRPRALAMAYFGLGSGARVAAERELTHYYSWLGPELSGRIAALALTDQSAVGTWLETHAGAGTEEVLLMPTSPDLAQVDLLAEVAVDHAR